MNDAGKEIKDFHKEMYYNLGGVLYKYVDRNEFGRITERMFTEAGRSLVESSRAKLRKEFNEQY